MEGGLLHLHWSAIRPDKGLPKEWEGDSHAACSTCVGATRSSNPSHVFYHSFAAFVSSLSIYAPLLDHVTPILDRRALEKTSLGFRFRTWRVRLLS
jgi:hypothetical protein